MLFWFDSQLDYYLRQNTGDWDLGAKFKNWCWQASCTAKYGYKIYKESKIQRFQVICELRETVLKIW